eukprot:7459251-Pyramimonas_sp.AAC.1
MDESNGLRRSIYSTPHRPTTPKNSTRRHSSLKITAMERRDLGLPPKPCSSNNDIRQPQPVDNLQPMPRRHSSYLSVDR